MSEAPVARDTAPASPARTPLVPLSWDSDLLGRPVARADVAGCTIDDVAALVAAVRAGDTALVYLFGAPADAEADGALRRAGARLVDRRTVFVRTVRPDDAAPGPTVAVRPHDGRWPDAALRALAIESGAFSRFNVDPRMPRDTFERLYETWITRSVKGEIADVVYVADVDGQTAGLITVGRKGDRADIGLLAVAAHARGRGLGRALVGAANRWAVARRLAVTQVVTQGDNEPACRLYAACGFAIESVTQVRHLWRADALLAA